MALFYTTLCYVYSLPVCSVVLCKGVNEVQTGCTIQRLLLHYPAAGYRNYNSGIVSRESTEGYIRSAAASQIVDAWHLSLSYANVDPGNFRNGRSFGFTVRCVSVF